MYYQHEQHTVHLIVYHIIWCPKRRRRILVDKIAQRLEQLIREVALEHDWTILELSIQPDHVHLFLRANPYSLPTGIARLIKGRSSHVLREEFPYLMKMPSLWTRSTFYSTAGKIAAIRVGNEARIPRSEIERLAGKTGGRVLVLYGRVSGHGQKEDLDTQLQRLRAWAATEIDPGAEKTPEQELTEDMLALLASFSGRLYGMRSHKQKELLKCAQAVINNP